MLVFTFDFLLCPVRGKLPVDRLPNAVSRPAMNCTEVKTVARTRNPVLDGPVKLGNEAFRALFPSHRREAHIRLARTGRQGWGSRIARY